MLYISFHYIHILRDIHLVVTYLDLLLQIYIVLLLSLNISLSHLLLFQEVDHLYLLLYFLGSKVKILPTYGIGTWKHYVMPVIALALYPTAYIMRLMRSSMLDVLGQDYMRTATAKGVKPFFRLFKHALRNALLPVITYVGPMMAYTMTGSFVVEKIFTIPGLGNEFVSSIINRDYTMIMGTTIFLATLMVVMNVLVDIVYKLVDPRIKLK